MENFIYLRLLKNVKHTVFCVGDNGQKYYYDPVFQTYVPYSSGQQIKRSIIDYILENIDEKRAPVTFNGVIKDGKIELKEPWSECDPTYSDQLIAGYMKLKNKHLIKDEESDKGVIKRRSPFSLSAMTPLHPYLANLYDENITFDRSDKPDDNPFSIRFDLGNKKFSEPITSEETYQLLEENNRTLERRIWVPKQKRASGLFVFDLCIDLRTLFSVSINQHTPEVSKVMIEKMKSMGWIESENIFGKCLVLPKKQRDILITAFSKALINWRITTNQSRTFSLMETFAISISKDANKIPMSIRGKLIDDGKAKPIIDEKVCDVFVTPQCSSIIITENEDSMAIEKAQNKLLELLSDYDYENQKK